MTRLALWALALFVFSIPSENGVVIPGVGSLSRLIGVFAFGMGILSLHDRGRLRFRTPSLFLIVTLLFVGWGASTYFWSIVPTVTLSRIITFAQLVVLVWLVHQVARTDRDRDFVMQAFVLGCYVIIAIGVTVFLGSGGTAFRDVGSFNANGFAIVSAMAIPMAWGLVLRRTFPALQVVNTLYPLAAMVAVVLAASRGGLLTSLVALTIIPLTLSRLHLWQRLILFAGVTAIAWSAFVWVPQVVPNIEQNIARLAEVDDELVGGTLTGRTNIWAGGLEVFASSPIVGLGLGAFNAAVEPIIGKARSPHNAFLSVAVGAGLVGLMLFVALFAILAFGIVTQPARRGEYLVLLLALIVGMMPTNSDTDKFAWLILALLASARPVMVGMAVSQPGTHGAKRSGMTNSLR